jgi:hypothetical protein
MILILKNKNSGYDMININFIYNFRLIGLLLNYIKILIILESLYN